MKEITTLNLQGGIPTITRAGIYQLVANEPNVNNSVIIQVDSSLTEGAVYIVLPDSSVFQDGQSPKIYIMDIGGDVRTSPINVYTASSFSEKFAEQPVRAKEIGAPVKIQPDLINGGSYFSISSNFGVCTISCIIFKVWMALGNVENAPSQAFLEDVKA
jgi:hypothetical protein